MTTRDEAEMIMGRYGYGMYEYGKGNQAYPKAESDALLALIAPAARPEAVTDEMIERAAKALYTVSGWINDGGYEGAKPLVRKQLRERARIALAAALAQGEDGNG